MMAMLSGTAIMMGKKTYEQVPRLLKVKVKRSLWTRAWRIWLRNDDVDKHNEIRAGPETVLFYCKKRKR